MNLARQAMALRKQEYSSLIRALLVKHKLSYDEASNLIHISRITIGKAARSTQVESISLDSLFLIHYHLEYSTWIKLA